MKLLKTTLFALSTLSITACSGGGGSGTAETPDGTKVNLTNSEQGLVGGKTESGKLVGWNNDSSFYGVWVDDTQSVKELRYQGTQTAESLMPKGSATYTGNAVYVNGVTGNIVTTGTSVLNADFDNKTVSGSISLPDARDITLQQGTISGSTFSGNASVDWSLTGNGTYQGAFYGTNAEEIAGLATFPDKPNHNTAFGGKR